MTDIMEIIRKAVIEATGIDSISLEVPPRQELGDYATPCFALSKQMKKAPVAIATELAQKIKIPGVTVKASGPYLNFFIDTADMSSQILPEILTKKENYGKQRNKGILLIESPGPNTNKPLHLGHLRNMLLGQSIANIMRFYGKEVHPVNVVNDRGVHICKSMLAYQKFGAGDSPEKNGRKSDHFVGDYYVKYSKAESSHPEFEEEIQKMLLRWEENEPETRKLWKQMNKWALDGFKETYNKLNFKIEKEYYESETYSHGRDIILKGLEEGKFERDEKGSIVLNLEQRGLGKKVLLRSNGTSVYITQDIYLAKKRYEDFKFDEMIYVVGNEQDYHFKVLFEVFKVLGWHFRDNCFHFSYGMVELPEGKMKSREGNVVDTDELIEEVTKLAFEEVDKRYPGIDDKDKQHRAHSIAMAAIRFFFLKFDPLKNFVFNPKESLAFEGETGPYVMYAYARICSIFAKLESHIDLSKAKLSLLSSDIDKKVLTILKAYPAIIDEAAKQHKPSAIAHYLFELASAFTEYYHLNPILKEEEKLRDARLAMLECTRIVLESGLNLLGIEPLKQM